MNCSDYFNIWNEPLFIGCDGKHSVKNMHKSFDLNSCSLVWINLLQCFSFQTIHTPNKTEL